MAYAIKCSITGSYVESVSFSRQSITLTKNKSIALPFDTLVWAKQAADQIGSPNMWPDYEWTVVEVSDTSNRGDSHAVNQTQ